MIVQWRFCVVEVLARSAVAGRSVKICLRVEGEVVVRDNDKRSVPVGDSHDQRFVSERDCDGR